MSEIGCHRACKNLPCGYAYHQMIFDNGVAIDYKFLEINKEFERIIGLDHSIIGKTVREVLPGIESEEFNWIEFYGKVSTGGEKVSFKKYSVVLCKWLNVTAYSPEYGTFVTLVQDIHEAELISSDFITLLKETGACRWEVNSDGLYINVYGANGKFFGYSYNEVVGQKHFFDLHPEVSREEFKKNALDIFRKKESFKQFENIVETKSGELKCVLTTGSPSLHQDGSLLGYRGIDIDVTNYKMLEKERVEATKQLYHSSKLVAIGELAASVGHEINNPLAILIGTLDLLKQRYSDQSAPFISSLNVMSNSCVRIQNIVAGLRTFARQDNDEIVAIDMHDIIEQALNIVEVIYKKDNIKILSKLEAKFPIVLGNSGRALQVLINFLGNARDAIGSTNSGEIIIATLNEKDNFSLSVTDNGAGISPENLKKIFDKFYTTKPEGKGTGLGLPISLKIIHDMGGEILVESTLNVGTTFKIILPSLKTDISSLTPRPLPSESVENILVSGTALVVDDEDSLRLLLANILRKMGMNVTETSDGKKALSLLEKSRYDFLVTDLKMPEIGGAELMQIARAKNYVKKIVAITGWLPAEEEDRVKASCDALILKPFKMLDIFRIIKELDGGDKK